MTESGWLIRAGNDNELVETFREESILVIGWNAIGDLSGSPSREEIKERYTTTYPERKVGRKRVDAGTLYRFATDIEENDLVLTYNKSSRTYYVGYVEGAYRYVPGDDWDHYPHRRSVDWVGEVERDQFSKPAKNTLGSTLTVFSVDDLTEEIESLLSDEESAPEVGEREEEDTPPYIDEVESTAQELISDIVAQMDPFDLEELVAAVLRAVGYAAETTKPGADGGVDVMAYPDELGFEDPVIKAQVKRTQSPVGNSDIGRFLGTLDPDEKGLYVSTGGYTNPARRDAHASSRRITLLDRDEFIQLLLDHYEELEQEYRAEIPLKPVYIPTGD